MDQPNTSQPGHSKQRGTLIAVGGFVVGASAMAAVIGLCSVFGSDESEFLGGANRASTGSPASTSTNNESANSSQVLSDEMNSTAIPTLAPSTPVPTFSPSVDTPFPTNSPTLDGEFPTEVPTAQGELNQSNQFTGLSILRNNEVGFRLKLYWDDGYHWQESTEERWWCMSCPDGNCEKNTVLELRNCKKKSNKDATFIVISHGNAEHQYRVANTDLCLQKMGDRRAIKLKPCGNMKKRSLQLFTDFKPDKKFELCPVDYTDRCLSQHHHPKAGEKIYAETCFKAHRVDTGYWVAY